MDQALDSFLGSLDNAATLIAALHRGEKRLVFCDSRQQVEQLGAALRAREVTVFLSRASLSAAERARSEQAFGEARDCVIVSTSTLELGIDVGDLDRVVQIDSPATVASFLQRIGRTGRRAGSVRNCLSLATRPDTLLQAAGLLLWGRNWVESVTAPPEPRHLVAQQLLAATLQQHKLGDRLWPEQWNGLAPFDRSAAPIVTHWITRCLIVQMVRSYSSWNRTRAAAAIFVMRLGSRPTRRKALKVVLSRVARSQTQWLPRTTLLYACWTSVSSPPSGFLCGCRKPSPAFS